MGRRSVSAGRATMSRRRERHARAMPPTGIVHGAQHDRTTSASAAHPALTPRGCRGADSMPEAPATSRGRGAPAQNAAKTGNAIWARVPARTPCVPLSASAGAKAHASDTRKRRRSEALRARLGIHAAMAASGLEATSRKVAHAPGVIPKGANGALRSASRIARGSAPPAYPSPPGTHADHAAVHSSVQVAGIDTHAPPTRPAEVPHH